MWYTYIMEYYAAIKGWNNVICSRRHALEIMIILSEVIQTQNDKSYRWYVESEKMVYVNLFTKQEGEEIGIGIYSLTRTSCIARGPLLSTL